MPPVNPPDDGLPPIYAKIELTVPLMSLRIECVYSSSIFDDPNPDISTVIPPPLPARLNAS